MGPPSGGQARELPPLRLHPSHFVDGLLRPLDVQQVNASWVSRKSKVAGSADRADAEEGAGDLPAPRVVDGALEVFAGREVGGSVRIPLLMTIARQGFDADTGAVSFALRPGRSDGSRVSKSASLEDDEGGEFDDAPSPLPAAPPTFCQRLGRSRPRDQMQRSMWLLVQADDSAECVAKCRDLLDILSEHGAVREGFSSLYRLSDLPLGSGRSADVFLAGPTTRRSRATGQPPAEAAAKLLRLGTEGSGASQGLEQEVSAFVRVQGHPNVLRFLGLFWLGNAEPRPGSSPWCIASEHCPEGDLQSLVEREALVEASARPLFSGILQGLAHIHERGVLHRDMKAANILLKANREPVVADFGSSCLASEAAESWGESVVLGRLAHMAPEVVSGKSFSERSDVFGAGTILFFMLSQVLPFAGSSDRSTLKRVQAAYVNFAEFPCFDSGELRAFLTQVLHRKPAQRPSAGEALMHPWLQQRSPAVERTTPGSDTPTAEGGRQALSPDPDTDEQLMSLLPCVGEGAEPALRVRTTPLLGLRRGSVGSAATPSPPPEGDDAAPAVRSPLRRPTARRGSLLTAPGLSGDADGGAPGGPRRMSAPPAAPPELLPPASAAGSPSPDDQAAPGAAAATSPAAGAAPGARRAFGRSELRKNGIAGTPRNRLRFTSSPTAVPGPSPDLPHLAGDAATDGAASTGSHGGCRSDESGLGTPSALADAVLMASATPTTPRVRRALLGRSEESAGGPRRMSASAFSSDPAAAAAELLPQLERGGAGTPCPGEAPGTPAAWPIATPRRPLASIAPAPLAGRLSSRGAARVLGFG